MVSVLRLFVRWGISLIMNKKSTSMNAKTLLYLILFSAGILLTTWFFQIVYLKYSYKDYQTRLMNRLANSIQRTSGEVSTTLEKIAYENEVCIEYHTYDGKNYFYNTLMNGCALGKNNPELVKVEQDFLASDLNIKDYQVVNKEYEAKAFLYGIKLDKGSVFLYRTLEDVSGANMVLKDQLIYLTVIAIVLASVVAYFLSKKLSGPILDITSKAKRLGSGTEVEFSKSGILEIDELSNVLSNAQNEMLKTDELRRDLMANVSHDLKTPLTMIKAYAEMVRDISYKDTKKREEHCNIIMDEVDRLNLLVNDILTLSKLQASTNELELVKFDLVKEIKTILSRYEIIKETEHYHFELSSPEKAFVIADQKKIGQVIYNLINNAINYTGEDKVVKIHVKSQKDAYLVEIIDTGKGIKDEELPYIWDKYYKNDKNHKRNVVSTGIGLSIVKAVLENHHFEYGVKSKVNHGTTFYFLAKKK